MDTIGISSRQPYATAASATAAAGTAGLGDLFASIFNQMGASLAPSTDTLARSTMAAPPPPPPPPPSRDASQGSDTGSRASGYNASASTPTKSSAADAPSKPDDTQAAAKTASPDKTDRPDKADKPAKADDDTGKTRHADKARKGEKGEKADKSDKTDKDAKADPAAPAAATDQTVTALLADGGAATGDKKAADDEGKTADDAGKAKTDAKIDPTLIVVPVVAPVVAIQAAPTAAGAGLAAKPGVPGGRATGALNPVVEAGADGKRAVAAQTGAGADQAVTAGQTQVEAQAADTGADAASVATSPLKAFAAALAGAEAAPVEAPKPAPVATQAINDLTPPVGAVQTAQAVAATGGTGADGGADANVGGDGGGSRGGQAGAAVQDPTTAAAGMATGAEGAKATSGQDFATQLATVRSARPGAAAGATDQVSVQLKQGVKDGNSSITMQLRPEELGRIDIRMDINKDGVVNAMITADRPQTLELLQRDSRSLERALHDAGLQTDSGSLSFGLRGEGGQGFGQQANTNDGGGRSGSNRGGGSSGRGSDDGAVQDVKVVTRRYQVAPGRVDVRI